MKPNILILSEYLPPDPGGMATYAGEIIPRLGKLGFVITVLVPNVKNRQRNPIDSENVHVTFFPSPKIHFFGRFTIFPALLRSGHLRDVSAIVDISVAPYAGVSSFVARKLRIPHLIGAHGNEVSRLYPDLGLSKSFQRYCKYAYRNANAIAANSHFTKSLFQPLGVQESQIHVVHNGVDTTFFCPGISSQEEINRLDNNRGNPRLLCVGQLNTTKGQNNLLRALPRIVQIFPEVQLDLAGTGVKENEFQLLAKELGISDHVCFLGHRSREDLRTLYRSSDVTIVPTPKDFRHAEGFALAAAEALACGCSVAASNWGGHTEYIRDGETGILFDANDPNAIAETTISILQDTELRSKIKTHGPELIANNYTWDHAAEKWAGLLERTIAEYAHPNR